MLELIGVISGIVGAVAGIFAIALSVVIESETLRNNLGLDNPETKAFWQDVLGVIFVAAGASIILSGIAYLNVEPDSIAVKTSRPSQLSVGNAFSLELTIENVSKKPITITDIGIDTSLLKGAAAANVSFYYFSMDCKQLISFPLFDLKEYDLCYFEIDEDILPGESLVGTITFLPLKAGIFTGDIHVRTKSKVFGVAVPNEMLDVFTIADRVRNKRLQFAVQ